MSFRTHCIMTAMGIAIAACKGSDQVNPCGLTGWGPDPRDVPATEIRKSELQGGSENTLYDLSMVVGDAASWNMRLGGSQFLAETSIDFNCFLVLAVFDMPRTEGCHSVEIVSVTEFADRIVAQVKHKNLGCDRLATSQPFHIIKIPRTDKPILFAEMCFGEVSQYLPREAVYIGIAQGTVNDDSVTPDQRLVIDNAADYNSWMDELSPYWKYEVVPDFECHQGILVIDQQYPNGGHTIAIYDVVEETDRVVIKVEKFDAGMGIQVITTPFHFILIPRLGKEVVFE